MWKVLNVTCYNCYMLQNVLPHQYLTHFHNAQGKSRLSERRAEYNTSYPERERFRWRQNPFFAWILFDCAKAMQWPPHCIALTSSFVVFWQPQKQRNSNVKIFYHEIWRSGFFSLTLLCNSEEGGMRNQRSLFAKRGKAMRNENSMGNGGTRRDMCIGKCIAIGGWRGCTPGWRRERRAKPY